jgi:hypothetical protein
MRKNLIIWECGSWKMAFLYFYVIHELGISEKVARLKPLVVIIG